MVRCLWVFIFLALVGCESNSIRRHAENIDRFERRAIQIDEEILHHAAASTHVTMKFLEDGDIESALMTHAFTINTLPRPPLKIKKSWENTYFNLDETLNEKIEYIITLEEERVKVGEDLTEERDKFVDSLWDRVDNAEDKLNKLINNQKLRSILVYIFSGAAVLLIILGVIVFKFAKGMAINFWIASGGMALAAYYVTTNWFAIIAAIIALIIIIGVTYMTVGRRRVGSTLRGVIRGIETRRIDSPDDVSKLEDYLSTTLKDCEKKLIKQEKKLINEE